MLTQVWEGKTMIPLHNLTGHCGELYDVIALTDNTIAVGGEGRSIDVWTHKGISKKARYSNVRLFAVEYFNYYA